MNHAMVFRFTHYSGFDFWRTFMPWAWQTKSIAKRLLKGDWKGADPTNTTLIVEMPWGAFRIVDKECHFLIADKFQGGIL